MDTKDNKKILLMIAAVALIVVTAMLVICFNRKKNNEAAYSNNGIVDNSSTSMVKYITGLDNINQVGTVNLQKSAEDYLIRIGMRAEDIAKLREKLEK